MTFFESFRKWNGKFVDVDNAFGPQCMDYMHQYILDRWNLPRTVLQAKNAKTVFLSFPNIKGSEHFTKIVNRPWNIPKQGDIVFFGNGADGHVCVFNEGNVFSFTSIDQNYPSNTPVHIQKHNYIGCLGWLHKK